MTAEGIYFTGRVIELVPSEKLSGAQDFTDRQVGPCHAVALPMRLRTPITAECGATVNTVEGDFTPGRGLGAGPWCPACVSVSSPLT
jgi:hypothetical protein